ncbi:hypothetical protein NDU88_010865 [Pleurodeles waltl]|uniref:Uncharacterized protein n=1 Tax=Pleurodeles waltl TaxID=8319 RepID=A0AAV7S2L7_PLEWA|nr:hypothetical protein NDU88_010865 [Pleurodeles waltl]
MYRVLAEASFQRGLSASLVCTERVWRRSGGAPRLDCLENHRCDPGNVESRDASETRSLQSPRGKWDKNQIERSPRGAAEVKRYKECPQGISRNSLLGAFTAAARKGLKEGTRTLSCAATSQAGGKPHQRPPCFTRPLPSS